MHIKIYFNDKPLFLCNDISGIVQLYIHHDDAVFIDELNSHTIKTMIYEMQQPSIHAGIFYNPDFEELKKAFLKKFTLVQAAGGLVLSEKKEILLIFRRGKWDLPKGKLDKGEQLEDCAIREVEEETGLKRVELVSPFITTYHTYHEGTKFILKESHWYIMKVTGEQHLVPQTDEDISEIRWIKEDDLDKYKRDSFPSVADVLDSFQTRLNLSVE